MFIMHLCQYGDEMTVSYMIKILIQTQSLNTDTAKTIVNETQSNIIIIN